MTMPNFLIIGAIKSGTTSLCYYLKQHPQIYMSRVKEPRFFALEGERVNFRGPGDYNIADESVTDIKIYRTLFQSISGERAAGEASALYLYSFKAPQRIYHYVPNAKLIAVLRNPIERAYSSFLHCIRDGREPLDDFTEALLEEEKRIRNSWAPIWHYKRAGFYHEQLKRYFDLFDKSQIRVYLYEDLNEDPSGTLRDIFRFLEVDESFIPDTSARLNVSGVPRNKALHSLVTNLNRPTIKSFVPNRLLKALREPVRSRVLTKPPQLLPEVRGRLIEVFREDILRLQELIDRDLSGWLEK